MTKVFCKNVLVFVKFVKAKYFFVFTNLFFAKANCYYEIKWGVIFFLPEYKISGWTRRIHPLTYN